MNIDLRDQTLWERSPSGVPGAGIHGDELLKRIRAGDLSVEPAALRAIADEVNACSRSLRPAVAASELDSPAGRLQEERRAAAIIEQIAVRRRIEAEAGRSYAAVMNVTRYDVSPAGGAEVEGGYQPEWLRGAAAIVFQYCVERGLRPALEHWDDVRGYYQGDNIVIHFEPERRRSLTEVQLAGAVLEQLPVRAHLEANLGRYHAEIMSIDPARHVSPESRSPGVATPEELTGAARLVFQYCRARGLRPDLQYWVDDAGEKEGFNLVIHWMAAAPEQRAACAEVRGRRE